MPAETLVAFASKSHVFRQMVREVIISVER
jgi:hypothetical protein